MNEEDIEKIASLDLYEILDIDKNSSPRKIKKSFRKLVLRFHPDKKNGDKDAFELINLAYSILKNNKLKSLYEKKRNAYLNSNTFLDIKKNNLNTDKFFPNNEKDAKIKFNQLEEKLNIKHQFNSDDISKISMSEINTRLDNLKLTRSEIDEIIKNKFQKKSLTKNDFNELFISNIKKEDTNNEIVAFNLNSTGLMNYTSIDNIDKLYSENVNHSNKYTSLDQAFKCEIPQNTSNNYYNHNLINEKDKINYKNTMDRHLNDIRKNGW